jgi:hypothetical protein
MHHLIQQIESQALDRAQKLFRRLGGQITQISDLIITNDIPLYTKCYVHSYNRLVKGLG